MLLGKTENNGGRTFSRNKSQKSSFTWLFASLVSFRFWAIKPVGGITLSSGEQHSLCIYLNSGLISRFRAKLDRKGYFTRAFRFMSVNKADDCVRLNVRDKQQPKNVNHISGQVGSQTNLHNLVIKSDMRHNPFSLSKPTWKHRFYILLHPLSADWKSK